jgi:hypothetical protein
MGGCSREGSVATLQLPVVGWPDAPPGVFGLRSIQMASIRAGGHPHGSGMAFALLAFVPRRRGAIGRAWALGGSRQRLALGSAVRPGVGSAPAQTSRQQTTLGVWTKRASGLKANGCTCTGPWTRPVRRSTSFSRPNAMQGLQMGSCDKTQ